MSNWRRTSSIVSMVVVLMACAENVRADDPQLTLRNDLSAPIDLYIASENSQSESPWHHFHLEAGQGTKVSVIAPDRYFVVLQMGNERSKSKPLDLKKFTTAHPDYVMLISEVQDMTVGGPMGGSGGSSGPNINRISAAVGADAEAASGTGANESLPVQFERFGADDQNIWSLSPDSVTLKLHNDLNDPVDVYIASKKSQNANPWTKLSMEPNGDTSIILKSPDPFMIRIDTGNESARSKPVELKSFLSKHRDYVLNVGRDYQMMMAGGPMGGSRGEEKPPKLSVSVQPDPSRQNSGMVGGGSGESEQLHLDWE